MPGILYGTNAKKYGWVDDVKFVIFGESEKLFAEDDEIFEKVASKIEPVFCKFVSDKMKISEKLEKKGGKIIYVGDYISKLIKQGYQVITF